jgi:mannose-6-phosphate isomerase-like protein (cupin superfamily)
VIVRRNTLQPIDFGALRIFDYSAGKDFDASLAVIEVPSKARHAEAWSKRSDKYYLVMQGALRFMFDGNESDLKAGDFCFVPRGQRFSYSNDSVETAVLVLVHTPTFRLEDEVFV